VNALRPGFGYGEGMTERLVRFGVAMEAPLLEEFDKVVERRGGTRSEAFRDLARAAILRARIEGPIDVMAVLTLVYDHHVRDLTEKLTELQHELGEDVRSTLHIHLDHDRCLEVIILRGRADELTRVAERLHALKGVKHGALEIITDVGDSAEPHRHSHAHGHSHAHPHPHGSGQAAAAGDGGAKKRRPKRR
jgi:CopG family transcriptional regulator, nickel-responsive regulator